MLESNHPNPLMERETWRSLNGPWRFFIDDHGVYTTPGTVPFDREIVVPFPPESQKSGIDHQGMYTAVWYTQRFTLEPSEINASKRVMLHFGAVDYEARVWVNGQLVCEHRGGHTPFAADVTDCIGIGEDGEHVLEVTVRAGDDPQDLAKPRGKQDWLPEPHAIWYPRTTGIWQDVWIEIVNDVRIAELRWRPYLERWEFGMEARIHGPLRPGLQLRVRLVDDGSSDPLADDRYTVSRNEVSRRIGLQDPGVDDFRDYLLWSPQHPHLIRCIVELLEGDTVLDRVLSYTAMRDVTVTENLFLLNKRPITLRLVLDQGYWPDTLMAAPDDNALRRDVELIKRLGFNGARKHQKLEHPRWLYWCDVLGVMVWEEMPSPYRFTPDAVERLTGEWLEALRRDASHPCIVAWVPLNESWGVPDLPTNPAHRDYVSALYHLTKAIDPTRPVIGNDGWEISKTDIVGIHDYTDDPALLLRRYGDLESVQRTVERQRPGGRPLVLHGFELDKHPVVLSEFGGVNINGQGGWGYSSAEDESALLGRFEALLASVNRSSGLAGFCYTQLCDTFQEKNGLLREDGSPKADVELIARAVTGRVRHN
jgi:beta-galactosidase/beta-glucuronidase